MKQTTLKQQKASLRSTYNKEILGHTNTYYNYKTITPQNHLNRVKTVCLRTPFTDVFLFIYIILSFYQLNITIGQRKTYKITRSTYKFKDLLELIKDNYKQYIVLSIIITIISYLW